ncbi:HEAT repeat domain-containing protein [Halolamina sp. C58]|uniref:HEAT repeat domain-containing protein n=1 Tax=Halolamina sp. C58 TaxID=3421640 RepID=UPI003EB9E404
MTVTDRTAALREAARTSPAEADLDALVDCLRADATEERIVGAETLGLLALAGRDVSPAVDAFEFEAWELEPFERSVGFTPGLDEEVIIPRTVAFGVCASVVTDHLDPGTLVELVEIHERQYPEFDADGRRYTAVGEIGWALASTVIIDEDRLDALLGLLDHDDRTVRHVAAAALSDVAEEYRSVHGHPVPRREELAATAAELLATSDDDRLRYRGAFTLYEFGMEAPGLLRDRLPLLRAALDDEYALVRKEAAGMLGFVGDEAAVDALEELAESDPSDDVQTKAAGALESIRDGE